MQNSATKAMKRGDIVEEELQEVTIDLNNSHDVDAQDTEREAFIEKAFIEKPMPTDAETQKLNSKKTRQAVIAVVFYWVVSLSLVFLNKLVMVGDVINLDAPLFMSWTQFVMTVIW